SPLSPCCSVVSPLSPLSPSSPRCPRGVPIVPLLLPWCPHCPHHPPIVPPLSPWCPHCPPVALWCPHGVPIISPLSPWCPHCVPVAPAVSLQRPHGVTSRCPQVPACTRSRAPSPTSTSSTTRWPTAAWPGRVNEPQKNRVLEEVEKSKANHFLILFRDGSCQFRALYTLGGDPPELSRLAGAGPRTVPLPMVKGIYKYNSDRKRFTQIPAKTMSMSVDAFTIQGPLGAPRKPGTPKKTRGVGFGGTRR
ncbi:uncharacterized protein LOC141939001, partial [Strix uralensis]|uniref:uncharacterized protein LOC141939001 n=1 Tax=Strix uralensis TaxID=36305 RepID=UPI003DA48934